MSKKPQRVVTKPPPDHPQDVPYQPLRKLTAATLTKICEIYASGTTIAQACQMVDVSFVAFFRYRLRHPEFENGQWAEAEQLNTLALENRALHLALTADLRSPTMLIFMLKARKPSVYRDNVSVNHSGNVSLGFAASFSAAMARAPGLESVSGSDRQSH